MPKPTRTSRRDDGDLIVEFCVVGPAVTAQVRGPKGKERLRRWKERVAQAARARIDRGITAEDVDVYLSEFSDARTIDRDNMAKPILDAMQGVVYANDRQVHLHSEWCNINGRYEVRHISSVVAAAMSDGREFVWVRVRVHRPRRTLR